MNSKSESFDLLNEFIEYASKRLIIEQEKTKGKNGYEDCMQDDKVKMSTEQTATRVVKDAILVKDENSKDENNIGD